MSKRNKHKKQENINEQETVDQVQNTEANAEENDMKKNENDKSNEEDASSIIERLEREKKELNDKFLRLYSEYDNYRKRTAKEKIETHKNASISVIKDVLSIADDFERAIENNKKSEDINAIKEGFSLIHNKLASFLKSKGVEEIKAKGENFDVDKHEAITQVPAPSEDDKGKVIDVVEKGYKIKDSIVRYPKVIVGK